jgi:ubiquinone/menaquinone biosynthesis C-methylase UbiE
MAKKERYIPALNQNWLTPLYDPLLKWGMREEEFKRHLVDTAHLANHQRVLDLGSGTGTLTILMKQSYPAMSLVGLDGDAAMLEIARKKAEQAGLEIEWQEALATALPFEDGSFDRVVSCLMTHHLTAPNKVKAFQEVKRVLKPDGEFHILDFGKPTRLLMKLISIPMARLEEAGDNYRGLLPQMLRQAGFTRILDIRHFTTIFGELVHYQISMST